MLDDDAPAALADGADGTTLLTYEADAVIGGMIGGVGQRVLAGVAKKTAAEFFQRRANGRSLDELDSILDKVPNRPPEPGDELPEGWTPPDWLNERR